MNREDLLRVLKHTTKDLFVMSETDAPFECLFWVSSAPFSPEQAEKVWGNGRQPRVQSLDDFLAPYLEERDWHSDVQRADVARFRKLKTILEANLDNLNVYKVGSEYEQNCWIVGRYSDQEYVLLRTFVVET